MAMMTVNKVAPDSEIRAIASRIAGDRHQSIHDPHDDGIQPAQIARYQACHQPEHDSNNRHGKADHQRDASAINDTRQHVSTEVIGAEPEFCGRHFQPIDRMDGHRIGCQHRSKNSDQNHDHQQQPTPEDRRMLPHQGGQAGVLARGKRGLGGFCKINLVCFRAHQYLILGSNKV